jgi:hypothetical protein
VIGHRFWSYLWKKEALVVASFLDYYFLMSTVSEIQAALPRLTAEELRTVDVALREQFRARKIGVLYDDAYGFWTSEDQASVAAEAFSMMDQQEKRHGAS